MNNTVNAFEYQGLHVDVTEKYGGIYVDATPIFEALGIDIQAWKGYPLSDILMENTETFTKIKHPILFPQPPHEWFIFELIQAFAKDRGELTLIRTLDAIKDERA